MAQKDTSKKKSMLKKKAQSEDQSNSEQGEKAQTSTTAKCLSKRESKRRAKKGNQFKHAHPKSTSSMIKVNSHPQQRKREMQNRPGRKQHTNCLNMTPG